MRAASMASRSRRFARGPPDRVPAPEARNADAVVASADNSQKKERRRVDGVKAIQDELVRFASVSTH